LVTDRSAPPGDGSTDAPASDLMVLIAAQRPGAGDNEQMLAVR
jgi:hypothetical protein